jgi:hypothetical protein
LPASLCIVSNTRSAQAWDHRFEENESSTRLDLPQKAAISNYSNAIASLFRGMTRNPNDESAENREENIAADCRLRRRYVLKRFEFKFFPIPTPHNMSRLLLRHAPDSDFFAIGNAERDQIVRQFDIDVAPAPTHESEFRCTVLGCLHLMSSLTAADAHYEMHHRHACTICHSKFPTARWLELHFTERHDSMFRVLAECKNMVCHFSMF